MSADTALMPIPGPVDPVPVPRAAKPRVDGKQELVGLFDRLTSAATPMSSGGYPGVSYRLSDGTVVRMRSTSDSGGPTIDISLTDGSTRKVHVR